MYLHAAGMLRDASASGHIYACVFCFSFASKEIPAEAAADMGRQEADLVWKKSTENIQEIFDFMEQLGS